MIWPQIDVSVAHALFVPRDTQLALEVAVLRTAASWIIAIIAAVALVGIWQGAKAREWQAVAFLVLAFALGPGLVVNAVLKPFSHRPRPVATISLGGVQDFRAVQDFGGTCPRNCSLASGEAAAAFWTMAPALLVPSPLQPLAISGALAVGIGVSVLRMMAGAHFLSDVCASALSTLAIIVLLYALLGLKTGLQGRNRPL